MTFSALGDESILVLFQCLSISFSFILIGFEIFNPETDDLDSEDENDDDDDDEDRSSSDSSSQESVVSAPNKSENEKLEMMRQTQSLDDPTQLPG